MNTTEQTNAPLAHQIPQACIRIGVSRSSLYDLMKSGAIRSFKVGSRTLIPETELQRFIDERMAAARGNA